MTEPTPEQDAVFAALVQDGQQYGEGEPLCHCGHRRDRHTPRPGIGWPLAACDDCPGDEERAWRHPFTPAPAPASVPVAADGTLRQAIAEALLATWTAPGAMQQPIAQAINRDLDAILPVVETHYAELQDEHREAHEIETENTARETERARVAEAAIEAVREWTRVEPVADAKFNEGYRAALADIAALLPKPLTPPPVG